MDDLTKHWSSLSLSEREGAGLKLKKEQATDVFTIAAKFFTKRALNIDAIARTFSPLWRSKNGFSIKNNGDHIILFSFDNEADVDRILSLEPWCFDKYLMAFSRINKETTLEVCNFNQVSFWVQVYNIPLCYRNKEVAEQICEAIGIIQHPKDSPDCDDGSFIRVRVSINISLPLCRGRLITLDDDRVHWVSFKYERLPNLCYWCGRLTHSDKDCEKWFDSEGSLQQEDQQFGAWIRVPPFVAARKSVVEVPGFFAKKKKEIKAQKAPESTSLPLEKSHTVEAEPANNSPATVNASCVNLGSFAFHGGTNGALDSSDWTEHDVSRKPTMQADFEHLIREIDKDINLFECGNGKVGRSNDKGRELSPNEGFRSSAHISPNTSEEQAQSTQPTPLRDITNLDPHLHNQAQAGKKWTRIQRPSIYSEQQESNLIIGKRNSPPFPDYSSSPKRRAVDTHTHNENPFPSAAADSQPRRQP